MNFAKFNKFRFDYDSETMEWGEPRYTNLASLYKLNGPDKVYVIRSMHIREAKEGDGSINKLNPIVTIEGTHVNIPQQQLEQIQHMLEDPGVPEFVNAGGAGFTIREYDNKYRPGEKAYSANFCNVEEGSHI